MKKEENDSKLCELCKGRLIKKTIKAIGNVRYDILKCERCKHTVARRVEEIIKV